MICAVPIGQKCRHPLVVVDFSVYFCLHNEQWIHMWVHHEISAGSVFLNFKNVQLKISSIEIFSISLYTKKFQSKFTNHLSTIWYRLQVTEETNGFTFPIINSWMESWPGLTVIPPSEISELFWAFFAFTMLFSLFDVRFFSLPSAQNKVNELLPLNSLLLFAAVKWRYGSSS